VAHNFDGYHVWVLCEDKNQYYFIRDFLHYQGFDKRRIKTARELPEGRGSGEQFVRLNLIKCASDYIRRNERVLLVAVQDTDPRRTPAKARDDFREILREGKMEWIEESGQLLLIFPKRNIETWFEWLVQEPKRTVDEDTDFKMKHQEAKPGQIGKRAGELYVSSRNDNAMCQNAPPSLAFACEEFTSLSNVIEKL
jgi:hypothetical protein